MIEVKLPEISENVESGTVLQILVSEGDQVQEEQPIVELETDKATFEVPCTAAGTVKEIKIKEGDDVQVGSVLLTLEAKDQEDDKKETEEDKEAKEEKDTEEEAGTEESEEENETVEKADEEAEEEKQEAEGEEEENEEKTKEKKESKGEDSKSGKEKKEKEKQSESKAESSGDSEEKKDTSDVPAAPSVRRLAREKGIDITSIKGSGPGGRITREDVDQARSDGKPKETDVSEDLPDFSKWGRISREPMSKIRQITAVNTHKSWRTIPQVTQFDQAALTRVNEFISNYKDKVEKAGGKLTITAVLLKICATALHSFPRFNASLDMAQHEIIYKDYIHANIAVDTPKGLLAPVIRNIDKKSIIQLAVEITEIAGKARDSKISPDELQGGNFTISNLGGIGGTNFTPIVYHPQVAILGIAEAMIQPVYKDGKFVPIEMLPLSLSYDHRIIDGAQGAKFLRWIREAMQDPFMALMQGGEI